MTEASRGERHRADAQSSGAVALPRKRNAWPVFVLLALAFLLPAGVFVGTRLMGGASGEAQFEALFSVKASERAAAHDYWAVSFRGSAPRLYNSTLIEEGLNERMRTAPPEAVSEFHRYFRQDPDYVFYFRPTAARAIRLRAGADLPLDAVRATAAELVLVLRQERAELPQSGPSLTSQDHENVRTAVRLLAERLAALTPETGAPERTSAAEELIEAAMLFSGELAGEATASLEEAGVLGEEAAAALQASVVDTQPLPVATPAAAPDRESTSEHD